MSETMKTVIRKLVENDEQTAMGQQTMNIKFSTDYAVASRLNLKMFYDKVIANPFITTTYPEETLQVLRF